MSAYSHRGWLVYLGLAGLALGIRLMAARGAYPACGDAGHFVQHGVALAKGLSGAMSTYWSQGMIAIAAGAVKAGCDPRYALQATTLIAGVAVVVFFAGILWSLTGSWKLAVVGGGDSGGQSRHGSIFRHGIFRDALHGILVGGDLRGFA